MTPSRLEFRSVREDRPGKGWKQRFEQSWPSYRDWFLSQGDRARPDLDTCRRQLNRFMPELVPLWEKLVELTGGHPEAARMLSLYRPSPYLSGCSQAVWPGETPLLVRNYDYHPSFCEGTLLLSRWTSTRVLGMSDCLWGLLDGINEHGLCLALSFGGRRVVGDGFGIPLVLRYVLELCQNSEEAIGVLRRVPTHMAYNVSILDAAGRYAVVSLSPDRKPLVRRVRVATNHQHRTEWTEYDRLTRSAERERHLKRMLKDGELEEEAFVGAFLEPPLFSRNLEAGVVTLYTAVYAPSRGTLRLLWPGHDWKLSMDRFRQRSRLVEFVPRLPARPKLL